jgi:hypothetical protein
LLFATVREYEPGLNPAGNRATALLFVKDTRASVVWANVTVGGRPVGLKLSPVIAMWLLVVFTTVL